MKTTFSKTITSQRQNNSQKRRRLSKAEIRKIYEEKFADRYFPAFRVIIDHLTMQFCPRDGAPLFLAKATYKSNPVGEAKCCPHCSTAFIQQTEEIRDLRTGERILWVCTFPQTCTHQKHHVVSATGILCKRTDLSIIEINIQYCYDCKESFITKQQYEEYKFRYKDLMGNLRFVESLDKIGTNNTPFSNLESPLHINGYSVNQNTTLTEHDRRNILTFLIDNNILSKDEVIYYLSMFIDMAERRNSSNMTQAISKWRSDLEWTNNYKFNTQYKIRIKKAELKPKKSTEND